DQRAQYDVEQIALAELHRREIDRYADVRRPARGGRAGALQHVLAERNDQTGLLGQRNELVGRDEPLLRMAPASQRLGAGWLARLDVDDRLVVHLQLVAREGLAQIV